MKSNVTLVLGWVSVGLAVVATSFLGFWGIVENFHEGWYHPALTPRIALMFGYLSFMFVFMLLSLLSVRCPWVGSSIFFAAGLFSLWFFNASLATLQILVLPAFALACCFAFGRPFPKARAYWLIVTVPILTVLISGVGPAWKVSQRIDDGNRGARRLSNNGVDLVWAPEGPGWPTQGMPWEAAVKQVDHLTEDGNSIANHPQGIWRLPTVEEAVRTQCRHGINVNGTWDALTGRASYRQQPDKESPLWATDSQVIYWWTADEVNESHAYIIVYDGNVWPRNKKLGAGYLAFRAVKSPNKLE